MALPTLVQRHAGNVTSDPFDSIQREFDSMLGRWLGGSVQQNGGRLAPYGVDVREDGDHIYVEAELPGFRKDDVDITLENQTLTIAAERKQEPKDGSIQGDWLLRERRYTAFLRSFTLPPTVDEQTVIAKLQDGILTVTLNKREESKPRRVQLS